MGNGWDEAVLLDDDGSYVTFCKVEQVRIHIAGDRPQDMILDAHAACHYLWRSASMKLSCEKL
jgi:hypothetical protein